MGKSKYAKDAVTVSPISARMPLFESATAVTD